MREDSDRGLQEGEGIGGVFDHVAQYCDIHGSRGATERAFEDFDMQAVANEGAGFGGDVAAQNGSAVMPGQGEEFSAPAADVEKTMPFQASGQPYEPVEAKVGAQQIRVRRDAAGIAFGKVARPIPVPIALIYAVDFARRGGARLRTRVRNECNAPRGGHRSAPEWVGLRRRKVDTRGQSVG